MKFWLRPDLTQITDGDTVLYEAPTSKVADAYFGHSTIDLGLLPPAVRWISDDGRGIIVERPPQHVAITHKETEYNIPLPWTVYGIRLRTTGSIDQAKVFVRSLSISTPSDELYALPMFGIKSNDSINMGLLLDTRKDVGPQLLDLISAFWHRAGDSEFRGRMQESTMPTHWWEQYEQGEEKFLVFLQSQDLQGVTFTDFATSSTPTMQQLMNTLQGEENTQQQPTTVMDYLTELVKKA